MREKEIEHNLVMETRKAGGMAVKFVSPSFSGMPDRLVLLPRRHAMLRRLGYQVFVLDSMEDIPAVLKAIAHTPDRKGGGSA
mgnify:CR=1 FL=1